MGFWCCLGSLPKYILMGIVFNKIAELVQRIVYPYYVAPLLGQHRALRRKLREGDWALVTGATDGIGKAYAVLLAKLFKANVVLVGRNASKLADVEKEVKAAAPAVSVKTLVFDFANETKPKDYERLRQGIDGLKVTCLVNAVGISYSELAPLEELERGEQQLTDILSVNALSPTLLTRMVLPGMKAARRGAVINISSSSGQFFAPYLGGYAASKRYLSYLSEITAMECAGSGVLVQDVSPFFVATKMSGMRASFTCPPPEAYALSAIGTFGIQEQSFGCFSHALQGEMLRLLPDFLVKMMMKKTLAGLMAKQRRKKAREAKAQ